MKINMKIKTDNLEGIQLDWVVAHLNKETIQIGNITSCNKIVGKYLAWVNHKDDFGTITYEPSIEWSQGGPIIEEKYIELHPESSIKGDRFWTACPQNRYSCKKQRSTGITPLIAAMRYYVKSCLGNEVEIPDELIKK